LLASRFFGSDLRHGFLQHLAADFGKLVHVNDWLHYETDLVSPAGSIEMTFAVVFG